MNFGSYPSYMNNMAGMQQSYTMPQPQFQAQPAVGFKCFPVSCKAEAEVYQIPFDGSTTYFVDKTSGAIYAKAFNFADGTAPIVTYVRETEKSVKYATIEDLNALRAELMQKGVTQNDE